MKYLSSINISKRFSILTKSMKRKIKTRTLIRYMYAYADRLFYKNINDI